jgi:glycosyltransferase involved in cell wall biosynthesis
MKILYIAPDITDSGGIARVVSLKANYLVSRMQYDISILSVNDCRSQRFYDFNPNIKWFNIKETGNKLFFLWNYIRFIKQTISKEKPDIIVVVDAVLWMFIPWFLHTKTPIIFETHFSVFYQKSKNDSLYSTFRFKVIRFLKQIAIYKFNCLVTITNEEDKERRSINRFVIPNPLSFAVKNKAALVNKKAMAVCVNPYVKGLDRLLSVWSRISEKHPDWELDIYGQWETNSRFVTMAADLKISNSVHFLPPTTAIQNSYNQSSLFLMTSRHETFPMVLLEAMTSGVPCIAYDCPSGPRTIIEEGVNGFLIQNGDSDSFVKKLEMLIEDESLRLYLGQNAKNSVLKYDLDIIMMQWKSFFEYVIDNKFKI